MVLLDQPAHRRHHLSRDPLARQDPGRKQSQQDSQPQRLYFPFRSHRHAHLHPHHHLPATGAAVGRRQVCLGLMAHHPSAHPLLCASCRVGGLAVSAGRQGNGTSVHHKAALTCRWYLVRLLLLCRLLHHDILCADLVSGCSHLVGLHVWHQHVGRERRHVSRRHQFWIYCVYMALPNYLHDTDDSSFFFHRFPKSDTMCQA